MPRKVNTPKSEKPTPADVQSVFMDIMKDPAAASKLAKSEDPKVAEAYHIAASTVADMNQSELALGQQLLNEAKRNGIAGNILAVSEVGSHARNAYDAGRGIYKGGAWIASKVAKLF